MSISRQNLTIVIVTLKSEKIIDQCLKTIDKDIPIIVVENSNNKNFKTELESKYNNLKCVLSSANLGMGAGNNIGLKLAKTDYVLILNPDVLLQSNTLSEIFKASEKINDFSVIAPINSDPNFPNYKILDNKIFNDKITPFKVEFVDGFAMLLNKKKFENNIFFDENIFLYLENNDLCLRIKRNNGSIYIVPSASIHHAGAQTVDSKYHLEVELSRNWHWIWSKFYYNKKNFGILQAIIKCSLNFFSSIIKFLFYFFTKNYYKKKIYYCRASGFYNALLGKNSWYRPNLED